MRSFAVTLKRKNSKIFNKTKVREQIDFIIGRATGGNRDNWTCSSKSFKEPERVGDKYEYNVTLTFKREPSKRVQLTPERCTSEMTEILKYLSSVGGGSKFGNYPWFQTNVLPNWKSSVTVASVSLEPTTVEPENKEMNVSDVVDFDKALPLDQIVIPQVLIEGSDDEIENFPAFAGIYGRASHIRVMFSSIQTMIDTKGMRRNHSILYGPPGCAKSSLFLGMKKVLPPGSNLFLNANSTTRAGVEAIFFDRLKITGVPPIMFIEEIEKTLEAILTVWLSITDERAEVRKITHHKAKKTEARVLCFATANDKVLFDSLMGGRKGHPGALSSRFTKPLYVPRPDWDIQKRILLRDIQRYGGQEEWADKAIEIAQEIKTNDPRIILSFLDGGKRLMTGAYKADIMKIYDMEKSDQKSDELLV